MIQISNPKKHKKNNRDELNLWRTIENPNQIIANGNNEKKDKKELILELNDYTVYRVVDGFNKSVCGMKKYKQMIIIIQVRDEDGRNLVSGKSGQRNQQSWETFQG